MEGEKTSSSQKLYKTLERMITEDEFRVGEKLPTELELCGRFGVGRSTVREAMRILEANGFISIKQGSGTYVLSKTGNNYQTIGNWLHDNKDKLRDYMEVRIAIEQLSVRLLIKKRCDDCERRLSEIIEAFETAIAENDGERISALDESFHREIALSTGNDLLIRVNELLADAFREYRRSTFQNKDNHTAAIVEHRKILEAINHRDTNEAVYAMREHLETSVENAIQQLNS
ncbi:FadR family transcriptional regulator [bacterium]|nr:FadR family transcriptional regulator [bacterium]